MYDVAEAAGVSPSTVSRTFSRPGRVSTRTANKIIAVAKQLGYEYQSRSGVIAAEGGSPDGALIAVSLADISNPYYAAIVYSIQAAISELGSTVVLVDTRESPKIEKQALERVQRKVSGMILCASRMPNQTIHQLAKSSHVVLVNRKVPGISCVLPDSETGMGQVIEHLYELGHRTVIYLSGPEQSWIGGLRWRYLEKFAHARGMTISRTPAMLPTLQGGIDALNLVLNSNATAVVAYNDLMALGLLRALQDRGIDVPGQISLVGVDNIFVTSFSRPTITSVALAAGQLGKAAVHELKRHMSSSGPHQPTCELIPVQLKLGESSGPVPRAT